jgi:diguanylate cyclase (GGDEF)-like protein
MASGFLVMVLTWYLLKVFILGRIISINYQISRITHDNRFNAAITLPGHDELSSLAMTINHMIDIITESQARLQYLATYDSLTQLPNRAHFHELLTLAISKAKLNQSIIAVMFIDMDKLKKVNDSWGHDVGDKLIQSATQRMKRIVKASDVLARQSGDEFLLYIENIQNAQQASETASRLLETTLAPFVIDGISISTTFSIGISLFPSDATSAEDLIKNADKAMYKAKTTSGNSFRFYEENTSYTA